MSDIAIRVENLGKLYHIGQGRTAQYETLRDRLATTLGAPVRQLRSLVRPSSTARSEPANDTLWALKDVSFEVKQGEVVGIIGRNGAGKSTLLKILSRITEPTSGYAEIHGRVGSLLEVGTGFHQELTGRENIYLNGAILGMKRAEIGQKFDEIVDFAEVEKFIDTPVKHYSSGMHMRLAFAVAAYLEPEILLIDEVLAVGDAEFQKKCLGKMGEVARRGRTVLFVSHNMAAVQQLCSLAFLIRGGQVHKQGKTESVVSNYLNDALSSEDGVFDFSSHPARPRQYRPIITKLILRSSDGTPTTFFYPDDSIQAEFVIEPFKPIKAPRLAFIVEDNLGRRIMTAASYFHDNQLSDINQCCHITCTLPQVGLGTGRYLISVLIENNYSGLLDAVDSAAWFEVGWRNNYANGETHRWYYGPVLTRSTWAQKDKE